jgi:hypothetical protein
MGEHHHVQELHEVQYDIVKHVISQNPEIKNFQLLLESSPCVNYYLDKLMLENDSISLKEFLLHNSEVIQDTLDPLNQARYNLYMRFYYLSKSLKEKTFQFNCYDNSLKLRPLVFTVLEILKKYPVADSLYVAQIVFWDSLVQQKYLEHKFFEFHQHFVNYITENKEMLQETLTETDFYYFTEMIRRSPPLSGALIPTVMEVTQERENMIFEQINNSYNDTTFFFCIIGADHISKPYNKSKLPPKFKKNGAMVIKMLETSRISNFKNKSILCQMLPLVKHYKLFQKDGTYKMLKMRKFYPVAFRKHRDYLNSLLTGNITLLDMRKTAIKRAHKITDYMIIVKEANSF